ncbi:MAG: SipW-dependent-type signal peptide-containing protein [Bacilli bacterium]|nr:SipW-dependent-type signal peptide-containing protein [Bacilli bacterium]
MNKKLFAPILSIAALAAVSIGATYALFTDKKEAKVDITAGQVKVAMTSTIDFARSRYEDATPFDAVANAEGTEFDAVYENGNTAKIASATTGVAVTLDRLTPMDNISLKVNVTNDSNVNIKWRMGIELKGELIPALLVKFDDVDYSSDTEKTVYTPWSDVVESETTVLVDDKPLYIAFPNHDDIDPTFDNLYQNKEGSVRIFVEAVQGNAVVEDPHETKFGFNDSYKEDGHWVHEISTVEEFKSMIIPNEEAIALADKAGLGDPNTVYLITDDISFGNQEPWTAMGLTSAEWEGFVFTGKLIGEGEQKVLSDSILDSADIALLTSPEIIGNLFCKVTTSTFENLEISNFVSEGNKAATGLVIGGNEPAAGSRHIYDLFIKDVTIDENCSIIGSKNTGAFAGSIRYFAKVGVEDYVNNANVHCTSYGAAGLAGTATGLKVLDMNRCSNYGTMSADQGRASGFIGAISGVSATPTESQTQSGAFKLTNCNSFGVLRDNSPKTSQAGGFFVGLQNATDAAAYGSECANNSIAAGTLYTTLSNSITCEAERSMTWINEHNEFDTHVEPFTLADLNLQIDVVNHTVSFETPETITPSYYTFQIAVDCMKLGADFESKTCWEIESKIKTVYVSEHYTTEAELESTERMISTMGYFMAQKDDVTIEKGDPSKYVHNPQTKLQEFAIAEEHRGQEGYTEEFSKGADGNYRFILLNPTCENDEFVGVNRMGTRIHYIVSAFDAGGNKIGGSEYTQMIYNGTDENVKSVLPTNGVYKFYKNYEW